MNFRYLFVLVAALVGGLLVTRITSPLAIAENPATQPSIFDVPGEPTTRPGPAHVGSGGQPLQLLQHPDAGQAPPVPAGATVVDLLKDADTDKSTVEGNWQLQDGALSSDGYDYNKFEFLYQPPEEYDYRVTFVPKGKKTVAFICWAHGHQFSFTIGGRHNRMCEFDTINGISPNPTHQMSHAWLTDGKACTAVVSIRDDGIKAYVDGKLICEWKTDYSDMSRCGGHEMPLTNCLGLLTGETQATFTKAQVVEITGNGKTLDPPADN